MQRATRKDILEFGFEMGRHAPKATTWHLQRILRYSATYGRYAEEYCNRELSDREMDFWNNRVRGKITELLSEIDCQPKFSGDPRGATVKIQVPDGYTNDWGKEGICVPTS